MMPLVWMHWLHSPSLVSIGKLKLSRNWISTFSNSDLDLDRRRLGRNPKLPLDLSYPHSKFGVNRPKQTKVIERKVNFHVSNSDLDLDHRHLGSNPTLPLDISYPHSKFGIKRPKQTKVIERKPKFDACTPARRRLLHYNNSVFIENLVHNVYPLSVVYLLSSQGSAQRRVHWSQCRTDTSPTLSPRPGSYRCSTPSEKRRNETKK